MSSDDKNRRADIALDAQIARLRELGSLAARAVPAVVKSVKVETDKQVARGEAPSGRKWRLTKEGKVPLRNAASKVTVTSVGTVVLMQIDGVEARHHLGAVKGKKQRRIIPTGDIPGTFLKAIKSVVTGEFFAIMETTDSGK